MVTLAFKGAVAVTKLTKKIVDQASGGAKPYFLWCSELKGFGVRVYKTGTKKFVVDYRTDDGSRKRMTMGAYGPLTVEDARKMALGLLGSVVHGEDPLTERQTSRKGMTVNDLCDRYEEALNAGEIMGKRRQPKKPSTVYQDKQAIQRHIRPLLGKRKLADLKRSHIRQYINDVTAGKTAGTFKTGPRGLARVSGGPGAASRTAGLLSSMLNQAVEWDLIETNPAMGIKRPADQKRNRRITPNEFKAIGAAIDAIESQGERWQGIAGLKLLIFTGCRLGDVQKLRWIEVDADGSCLRIEDSKEGYSVRPVGKIVFDILGDLPRETQWVFPATRGTSHFTAMDDTISRVMNEAQIEGVTAHTFRHTFASVANELGYSEATVASLLGQRSGSVTRQYIHSLDSHLIAAAQAVCDEISSQMGHK